MTNIPYNYEVVSTNEEYRTMEVRYTADGKDTVVSTIRMPVNGQDADEIIRDAAPLYIWTQQAEVVVPVEIGKAGSAVLAVPATPTAAELAVYQRNGLLALSDWTQLTDVPLPQASKDAWATYRQSLRDITAQPGFPDNIVWPQPPM